jgi:ABC-type transporter Mla subunit MlaD
MNAAQEYAKAMNSRIIANLRNAIKTLRDTADDAEQSLNRMASSHQAVSTVLARLRNGQNNALASVESAVAAMADKAEALDPD